MKKVSFLIISSFLVSSMIMRTMDKWQTLNTDEQIKYLQLIENRTEQGKYPKLSVLQKAADNALDQLVNSAQQDSQEVYTAHVNAQKVLFAEQVKKAKELLEKKAKQRQSIKK